MNVKNIYFCIKYNKREKQIFYELGILDFIMWKIMNIHIFYLDEGSYFGGMFSGRLDQSATQLSPLFMRISSSLSFSRLSSSD